MLHGETRLRTYTRAKCEIGLYNIFTFLWSIGAFDALLFFAFFVMPLLFINFSAVGFPWYAFLSLCRCHCRRAIEYFFYGGILCIWFEVEGEKNASPKSNFALVHVSINSTFYLCFDFIGPPLVLVAAVAEWLVFNADFFAFIRIRLLSIELFVCRAAFALQYFFALSLSHPHPRIRL